MGDSTEIRNGKHVVFLLHAHLVFVTKYRKGVFTKSMLDSMRDVFNSVCSDFESSLVKFDGEKDHVHLLVNYPPKVSISKLVNSLKGVSSRILRRDFKREIGHMLYKGVLWSPSYFAGSCGGAPLETVKSYIQEQKTPR
jgi:putative transposase